MELTDFVLLLRRRAGFVAVMVLVGLLAAAIFSGVQKPTYTAVVRSLVSTPRADNASDLQQGNTFTQQVVNTYAAIANSTSVLQEVIDQQDLSLTADDLATNVTASAPANTSVVEISVKAGTAELAASIANGVATELAALAPTVTPSTTAGESAISISIVQPATAAATSRTPNWTINLALGFVIGLVAGIGIVVVRASADPWLRTPKEAVAITGVPVLGLIGSERGRNLNPLRPFVSGTARAERFRTLRTNLQVQLEAADAKVCVVASLVEGVGGAIVTANTAAAFAMAGRRVLVIDANLRSPQLGRLVGAPSSPGLSEVLSQSTAADAVATLDRSIVSWSEFGSVLPTGEPVSNESELLQSPEMARLIDTVRAAYDIVLIDTPSVLDFADAVSLARIADGVILVAAAGKVRRDALAAATAGFDQVGARLLGVVVTRLRGARLHPYGHGARPALRAGAALQRFSRG